MYSAQKKFTFFILLLVAFIDFMGIGLVYPMFSSMLFHPGYDLVSPETSQAARGFWLGILLAAMPIAQFLSSPLIGALSDQKGRKRVLIWSLLFGVAGYALAVVAVWAKSMPLLLFSRLVVGVGAGSGAVVGAAIADLSSPEDKAKNFGLMNMAFGIGFTVGPFLGGHLSDAGYDKPFLFAGVITLLNLVLLYYFFKETHHLKKEGKIGMLSGIVNLKKAFKLPGIRVIFLCVLLYCIGWSFFWEFIPVTWIQLYNMSAVSIGTLYAYGAGFYALSCGLLIRPVMNKVRPEAVLFYSLVLLGIFIFFLLGHPKKSLLWALIPFQQFFIALLIPTSAAMVSNWVKEDAQGEMMGVLQSVEAAAFALSPLLSGTIVGLNPDMPILVGGVAVLLAALVVLLGLGKEIKKWRA